MDKPQGDNPELDPEEYGLKFDSDKPRWELLPHTELLSIVRLFNDKSLPIDLTEFNELNLINDITTSALLIKSDKNNTYKNLRLIAFKMFFLLRGKPYSKEELNVESDFEKWHLLNLKDVEGVVEVYTKGAKKYADNNWQKVSKQRYYGALLRHLVNMRSGKKFDSELGCLHAYQVIWNLMSLMWLESRIPDSVLNASKKVSSIKSIVIKPDRAFAKKKTIKKVVKKRSKKV